MTLTANELILDLCMTRRPATAEEITTVVTHVAQAPFATYLVRVPVQLQEALAMYGIQLSGKQPSLEQHLLKRIYDEKQWPVGTSPERYVADLHQAILQWISYAIDAWSY